VDPILAAAIDGTIFLSAFLACLAALVIYAVVTRFRP
jgi:hypothetical protein